MELIVETSLQLICEHGSADPHPLNGNGYAGGTCFPPEQHEIHYINYPEDEFWIREALDQLVEGQADLIQIMARRG